MFRIRVERTLDAPIEFVFGELTDHGNFDKFPGVSASEVVEPGHDEPNGVGALRRLSFGPAAVFERIQAYESPTRLEYRIERSKPLPIAHRRGLIELAEHDGGTRVVWISEGRVALPVVGRVLDFAVQRQVARSFGSILRAIERSAPR